MFSLTILLVSFLQQGTAGGEATLLQQWEGTQALTSFATEVAMSVDLNGDGIADILVSDPSTIPPQVLGFSGQDGSQVFQVVMNLPGFAQSMDAVGDLDQDGCGDVVIGVPFLSSGGLQVGAAQVYSGKTGLLIFEFLGSLDGDAFGTAVAGVGDVNGDGWPDVAVGSPYGGPFGFGKVQVFSGRNGLQLRNWTASSSGRWGEVVSAAGDVNGDGFPDVLVGALAANNNSGGALVLSGSNAQVLQQWSGTQGQSQFGFALADAGDLDGDGLSDIAVGAPLYNNRNSDEGTVYVYSGVTGNLLLRHKAFENGREYATSVAGAGDINGDGVGDLLVGSRKSDFAGQNSGCVDLVSGSDGALIHRWNGDSNGSQFGTSLDFGQDMNGDGTPDFVIGGEEEASNFGRAQVWSFAPFMQADRFSVSNVSGATLNLSLDFPDTAAGMDYRVLMSISGSGPVFYGVNIPLTFDNFLLNSASGIYPFVSHTSLGGVLDASGNASASIDFPAGSLQSVIGARFWLATIAMNSGSLPSHSSIACSVVVVQ